MLRDAKRGTKRLLDNTISRRQKTEAMMLAEFEDPNRKVIDTIRKDWERERETLPKSPSFEHKAMLVAEMTRLRPLLMAKPPGFVPSYEVPVAHNAYCSLSSLEQLTPISLRSMDLHRRHSGRYLLCRVVAGPDRKVATEFVVSDPAGTGVTVFVHHFPGLFQASRKMLEATFPLGQLLAIREPWLMKPLEENGILAQRGPNLPAIHVDSPSDIVFLSGSESFAVKASWPSSSPDNPYLHDSVLDLKTRGTVLFTSKLYIPAARVWSLAILKDRSVPELYLNRAQAYISLGWFEAALRDAEHVLKQFPDTLRSKALYRGAVALYRLERYNEALEKFKGIPDSTARSWEARCAERVKESETGKYRWGQLFKQCQSEDAPRLDVASYAGPVGVKLISERRGRGVTATRNVAAGELLIVAKPFAAAYPADLLPEENCRGMNFVTLSANPATFLAVVYAVMTRLHGCPELIDEIHDLYSGSEVSASRSPESTRSQPSKLSSGLPLEIPLVPSVALDTSKISAAVTFNLFESPPLLPFPTTDTAASLASRSGVTALYTGVPSMFNHSCNPNAFWCCFGDTLVVRALWKLRAGEEITIAYAGGGPYFERAKLLKVLLDGAECACELCEWDRIDGKGERERRASLVDALQGMARSSVVDLDALAEMDEEIADTYIKSSSLPERARSVRREQFEVESLIQRAARGSTNLSHWTADDRRNLLSMSVDEGCCALRSAGYTDVEFWSEEPGEKSARRRLPFSKTNVGSVSIDHDDCIQIMLLLSVSFVELGDLIWAERWYRAAWWAHSICYGGGRALFDARFGDFLHTLELPRTILSLDYGWD